MMALIIDFINRIHRALFSDPFGCRDRHIFFLSTIFLCLAFWRPPIYAQEMEIRRFALIIGANSGGPERVKLQYATTDATSFGEVMEQLGGLERQDKSLLLNPSRERLQTAFSELSNKMAQAKEKNQRVEFLFYFSGHSDEKALLLDTQRMTYREARSAIDDLPADVKIAVLDSCASGAFTRLKGGKYKPPFLMDAQSSVKGHAFLTSSSQDEAAQESDKIMASFFTHYLVSGLRGGADLSNDGRVTLNEAYRFAFDETLARTESTRGGPQHPAYDIQLVGTGDLVMTDIRQTSATLSIESDIEGRIYLRDQEQRLVAELYKPKGRAVELGLPPGDYQIVVDQKGSLKKASVRLPENKVTLLSLKQLKSFEPEMTATRGSKPAKEKDEYRTIPFAVSLFPPIDSNQAIKGKVINNLALNFVLGRATTIKGVATGIGANWADEDLRGVQASVGFNYVGRDTKGVQATVGFNYAGEDTKAVQASVGFNHAGNMRGIQATVGANSADKMDGIQASVGANVAPEMKGVQATVGANVVTKAKGIQLSVGPNVATESMIGMQVSVAPNIAYKIKGAQIGLINIAASKVDGAQIGLINYADEADASLALIGITRKGGVHPQFWTSDLGLLNAGLRFDANYTYTFLSVGFHPFGKGESFLFGCGFGLKIHLIEKLWLDTDLSNHLVVFDKFIGNPNVSSFRLLARWQFMPHLAIFGGPTFNVLYHFDIDDEEQDREKRPGYSYSSYTYIKDHREVMLWPGFALGVQF